eukprot:403357110
MYSNQYRQTKTIELQYQDNRDVLYREPSNPQLVSERVNQLKKEIEDLDNKLMSTNTINFQEIRSSIRDQIVNQNEDLNYHKDQVNDQTFSSDDEQQYSRYNDLTQSYNFGAVSNNQNFEIEETIIRDRRKSQEICGQSLTQQRFKSALQYNQPQNIKMITIQDQLTDDFGVPQIYHRPQLSQGRQDLNQRNQRSANPHNLMNTSHLSVDGEISFDLNQIYQKRNENIRSAFENNLKQKQDMIIDLKQNIKNVQKDCDAKTLKLAHLKYERDSIINQMQMDGLKKKEKQKEIQDEKSKIDIKRKEDERAYNLAQNEIKRSIMGQETTIQNLCEKADLLAIKLQEAENAIKEQKEMYQNQNSITNEIEVRLNQQTSKITSLVNKKSEVDTNIQILRDFLLQIGEEIQMTQEDLSGKLMQRAEFVAQREELDQMYDTGKKAFGRSFEIFLRIKEINNNSSGNLHSARYLDDEYESAKAQSFFVDILQQLRSQCKSKFYEKINQIQQKIDQETTLLDLDKCISMIITLSQSLGVLIDKQILLQKLDFSSQEKDKLFEKRQVQLVEIVQEIKRFEKLIKENSNLVDNMILPQLKAMSTTYNEHKQKYKKLKQASFVLKERIKKADKEKISLQEEKSQYQSQFQLGQQIKHIEQELISLNQQIINEQQELDRLNENASQIDKEFRRAQQSLLLKERELMRKFGNETLKSSFNGTQSSLLNSTSFKQEHEEDKLKKIFQEIEEKIKNTLKDKEQAFKKHNEISKMLKEAQESMNHAQQMMISTQRIIESSNGSFSAKQSVQQESKVLPNNRRHYSNYQQNHDQKQNQNRDFQDEFQITSVTESEFDKSSNLGSKLSHNQLGSKNILNQLNSNDNHRRQATVAQSMIIDRSQNLQTNNSNSDFQNLKQYKSNFASNQSQNQYTVQTEKENNSSSQPQHLKRKSIGKIDLTKALAYRDNMNRCLDEPEIINQSKNSIEMYQNIPQNQYTASSQQLNSYKFQQDGQLPDHQNQNSMYQEIQKQNTLTLEFLNKLCSKNATIGSDFKINGEDLRNLLQQSNAQLTENQLNNSNLSIMNLSDLLINNNAIQNLMSLAGTQESRSMNQLTNSMLLQDDSSKPFTQLTFNNTQNQNENTQSELT